MNPSPCQIFQYWGLFRYQGEQNKTGAQTPYIYSEAIERIDHRLASGKGAGA